MDKTFLCFNSARLQQKEGESARWYFERIVSTEEMLNLPTTAALFDQLRTWVADTESEEEQEEEREQKELEEESRKDVEQEEEEKNQEELGQQGGDKRNPEVSIELGSTGDGGPTGDAAKKVVDLTLEQPPNGTNTNSVELQANTIRVTRSNGQTVKI